MTVNTLLFAIWGDRQHDNLATKKDGGGYPSEEREGARAKAKCKAKCNKKIGKK